MLLDILDTPVSPELLPPKDGKIAQKTEDLVGPYELHDFFLYYILRFGFDRRKSTGWRLWPLQGTYDREDDPEMAEDLLPEIFRPAVQAFLSAGRPEGGNRGRFPERRSADAQRCQRGDLACGTGRTGKIRKTE